QGGVVAQQETLGTPGGDLDAGGRRGARDEQAHEDCPCAESRNTSRRLHGDESSCSAGSAKYTPPARASRTVDTCTYRLGGPPESTRIIGRVPFSVPGVDEPRAILEGSRRAVYRRDT